MAIESSRISEISPRINGVRVRFEYTFTNGSIYTTGSHNFPSQAIADQKLIDFEPYALERKQRRDAVEALSLGIKVAHGEATTQQVMQLRQEEGVLEEDSLKAFRLLNGNVNVSSPQHVRDRWAYLNAHRVAIEAYRDVLDGDN